MPKPPNLNKLEWIPVNEELPDAEMMILVHVPGSDEPVDFGAYVGDTMWVYADGSEIIRETVTHWMDLPEPPAEGI